MGVCAQLFAAALSTGAKMEWPRCSSINKHANRHELLRATEHWSTMLQQTISWNWRAMLGESINPKYCILDYFFIWHYWYDKIIRRKNSLVVAGSGGEGRLSEVTPQGAAWGSLVVMQTPCLGPAKVTILIVIPQCNFSKYHLWGQPGEGSWDLSLLQPHMNLKLSQIKSLLKRVKL